MRCNPHWTAYVSAFAVPAIAVLGVFIALLQARTARNKLKLDLFDRRFAVYDKTVLYYQAYYSAGTDTDAVRRRAEDFIRAYRESWFLFGPDSEVYKAMTDVKDTLSFLVKFEDKFRSPPYDDSEHKTWLKLKAEKPDLTKLMESLERALSPWLDSRRIK
jgi:hypothetical protein